MKWSDWLKRTGSSVPLKLPAERYWGRVAMPTAEKLLSVRSNAPYKLMVQVGALVGMTDGVGSAWATPLQLSNDVESESMPPPDDEDLAAAVRISHWEGQNNPLGYRKRAAQVIRTWVERRKHPELSVEA